MSNFFQGYLDDQLTSDEHVLYRAHLSWVPVAIHMVPIMMIAGAISGVIWGVSDNLWLGLLALVILLLVGFLSQLGYIYQIIATDILVTNRRFTYKIGIVKIKDNRESSLSRIDDTDIDINTIPERIFKYGDITVQTLGGGGKDFYAFKHVARPRLLKKAINTAKDQYEMGSAGESAMGSRGVPAYPQQRQSEPEPLTQKPQQNRNEGALFQRKSPKRRK